LQQQQPVFEKKKSEEEKEEEKEKEKKRENEGSKKNQNSLLSLPRALAFHSKPFTFPSPCSLSFKKTK